jgi:hypothetical protein
MHVEISGGDAKFLYAMKLVSQSQRSRVSGVQSIKVLEFLNANSLHFLNVRRCLSSEWHRLRRRRRKSLFKLTKTNYALYNHLGITLFSCYHMFRFYNINYVALPKFMRLNMQVQ